VHAAGSGAAGGSGLSLKQKLEQVLIYLGMDVTLPMATAVKRANEAMGISPEGPLPAQVDRLLAAARRAQGGGHVGT
jgi:NAD(P)H-dependent FMN reductase